jgi:hypothetical protein
LLVEATILAKVLDAGVFIVNPVLGVVVAEFFEILHKCGVLSIQF